MQRLYVKARAHVVGLKAFMKDSDECVEVRARAHVVGLKADVPPGPSKVSSGAGARCALLVHLAPPLEVKTPDRAQRPRGQHGSRMLSNVDISRAANRRARGVNTKAGDKRPSLSSLCFVSGGLLWRIAQSGAQYFGAVRRAPNEKQRATPMKGRRAVLSTHATVRRLRECLRLRCFPSFRDDTRLLLQRARGLWLQFPQSFRGILQSKS